MNGYYTLSERESCLHESINELDSINRELAKLLLRKEELTGLIIGALGHEHEGQKSYEYDVWKIEVKTPFIYSLNKSLYESIDINIPDEFNPIKQSVSYSIDKKLCDKAMSSAPDGIRDILIELIDKKPGKPSVNIRERL